MASSELQPGSTSRHVAFAYQGHEVTFDDNRLINLTEMWRAQGCPANKEPKQWRRKEGASFIEDLVCEQKVPRRHLLRADRGRNGATWAHWQIALAYAKYLSNEFHRRANDAIREWSEEKANPDLKADRAIEGYRRQGASDSWIDRRLKGKLTRYDFADCLGDHGVEGKGYADCTDVINIKVLGGTAQAIKKQRGLPARASVRDNCSEVELAGLQFAELLAQKKIQDDNARGTKECLGACMRAGSAIKTAIAVMNTRG